MDTTLKCNMDPSFWPLPSAPSPSGLSISFRGCHNPFQPINICLFHFVSLRPTKFLLNRQGYTLSDSVAPKKLRSENSALIRALAFRYFKAGKQADCAHDMEAIGCNGSPAKWIDCVLPQSDAVERGYNTNGGTLQFFKPSSEATSWRNFTSRSPR